MLEGRTHTSDAQVQRWISLLYTAYGAGELVMAPICGWFADRYRVRKALFLVGLALQLVAMLLLGLGNHVWVYVMSRVLSGAASGIAHTIGFAMVFDIVNKNAVGQWTGFIVSVSNVADAIAPLIGGALFTRTSFWRVMGLELGLLGIDLVLRSLMLEQSSARSAKPNAITCQKTLEPPGKSPMSSLSSFEHITHSSTDVTAASPLPKHHSSPTWRLIKSPRILSACYGLFVSWVIAISLASTLVVFTEDTFAFSAFGSGTVLLALGAPAVLGFLQGWLADRYGNGVVTIAGCVLTPVPLILLRLIRHNTSEQIALLFVLLVLIGEFLERVFLRTHITKVDKRHG